MAQIYSILAMTAAPMVSAIGATPHNNRGNTLSVPGKLTAEELIADLREQKDVKEFTQNWYNNFKSRFDEKKTYNYVTVFALGLGSAEKGHEATRKQYAALFNMKELLEEKHPGILISVCISDPSMTDADLDLAHRHKLLGCGINFDVKEYRQPSETEFRMYFMPYLTNSVQVDLYEYHYLEKDTSTANNNDAVWSNIAYVDADMTTAYNDAAKADQMDFAANGGALVEDTLHALENGAYLVIDFHRTAGKLFESVELSPLADHTFSFFYPKKDQESRRAIAKAISDLRESQKLTSEQQEEASREIFKQMLAHK